MRIAAHSSGAKATKIAVINPVAVARFQLFEEAYVFDGNDGLGSEGFEQCDLRRGKRTHLRAENHDDADRAALAHQRGTQKRAMSHAVRVTGGLGELAGGHLVGDVRDLDRGTL